MIAVDEVSVAVVIGVGTAFLIGIIIGIVLTLLASKSAHPVVFDWRLLIRRSHDAEDDA